MNFRLSKKAEARIAAMIERFKTGNISEFVHVAKITLKGTAPATRWTMRNRTLAFLQTGELDCRTYNQWQDVGRQVVKKGAAYIFGPCKGTREIEDAETGETRRTTFVYAFRSIPVFPASYTEGDAITDHENMPIELPPLVDVARALGIDVAFLPLGNLGEHNRETHEIKIGSNDPAVFFHELAHALHTIVCGHEASGDGPDPYREAVAEFTGAVLMDLYDFGDRTGNAWTYVKSYNPESPLEAILAAAGDVEQIVGFLGTLNAEKGE